MIDIRQVFVIQCKSTGEFLTEELSWRRSFKQAGRLFDLDEAVSTALDHLDPDDFEIHPFYELKRKA